MEHVGNRCDTTGHATCGVCGLIPVVRTPRHHPVRLVCKSEAMQKTLRRAALFARSDAPVVVLGETGSGKEVVARVLHANSPRRDAPFVAINVAAMPSELLESELFGHARGAFTGAHAAKIGLLRAASGGTLFLDEIGEMPLGLQAKLLRALSDREVRPVGSNLTVAVDVRVQCATHRNLSELVRIGQFREDLYYRLKVLTLRVPPLRERRGDIMTLARQFLAEEPLAPASDFSADAVRVLEQHGWPGNVRELASAVKHGVALATGSRVEPAHLPDDLFVPPTGPALMRPLADVEREHVLAVLGACGGSMGQAARVLDIGRNTLWRKLKRWE